MGRHVRDVMTREVVTVDEDTPLKEIVGLMADCGVSALPVVDADGRVVGIVSEADLVRREEFPDGPPEGQLFEGRRRREARAKLAGATAVELMTSPAITVGPDASIAEAARLLHRHRIKRLPVLDPAGPLLGIVSRADLLKVFLRADADLATDVRQQVLRRTMAIDSDKLAVEVRDGVVTVGGRLERSSLVPILVGLIRGLDGVVDVVDQLTYETDDTPFMVPSDLLIDRAPGVRRRL